MARTTGSSKSGNRVAMDYLLADAFGLSLLPPLLSPLKDSPCKNPTAAQPFTASREDGTTAKPASIRTQVVLSPPKDENTDSILSRKKRVAHFDKRISTTPSPPLGSHRVSPKDMKKSQPSPSPPLRSKGENRSCEKKKLDQTSPLAAKEEKPKVPTPPNPLANQREMRKTESSSPSPPLGNEKGRREEKRKMELASPLERREKKLDQMTEFKVPTPPKPLATRKASLQGTVNTEGTAPPSLIVRLKLTDEKRKELMEKLALEKKQNDAMKDKVATPAKPMEKNRVSLPENRRNETTSPSPLLSKKKVDQTDKKHLEITSPLDIIAKEHDKTRYRIPTLSKPRDGKQESLQENKKPKSTTPSPSLSNKKVDQTDKKNLDFTSPLNRIEKEYDNTRYRIPTLSKPQDRKQESLLENRKTKSTTPSPSLSNKKVDQTDKKNLEFPSPLNRIEKEHDKTRYRIPTLSKPQDGKQEILQENRKTKSTIPSPSLSNKKVDQTDKKNLEFPSPLNRIEKEHDTTKYRNPTLSKPRDGKQESLQEDIKPKSTTPTPPLRNKKSSPLEKKNVEFISPLDIIEKEMVKMDTYKRPTPPKDGKQESLQEKRKTEPISPSPPLSNQKVNQSDKMPLESTSPLVMKEKQFKPWKENVPHAHTSQVKIPDNRKGVNSPKERDVEQSTPPSGDTQIKSMEEKDIQPNTRSPSSVKQADSFQEKETNEPVPSNGSRDQTQSPDTPEETSKDDFYVGKDFLFHLFGFLSLPTAQLSQPDYRHEEAGFPSEIERVDNPRAQPRPTVPQRVVRRPGIDNDFNNPYRHRDARPAAPHSESRKPSVNDVERHHRKPQPSSIHKATDSSVRDQSYTNTSRPAHPRTTTPSNQPNHNHPGLTDATQMNTSLHPIPAASHNPTPTQSVVPNHGHMSQIRHSQSISPPVTAPGNHLKGVDHGHMSQRCHSQPMPPPVTAPGNPLKGVDHGHMSQRRHSQPMPPPVTAPGNPLQAVDYGHMRQSRHSQPIPPPVTAPGNPLKVVDHGHMSQNRHSQPIPAITKGAHQGKAAAKWSQLLTTSSREFISGGQLQNTQSESHTHLSSSCPPPRTKDQVRGAADTPKGSTHKRTSPGDGRRCRISPPEKRPDTSDPSFSRSSPLDAVYQTPTLQYGVRDQRRRASLPAQRPSIAANSGIPTPHNATFSGASHSNPSKPAVATHPYARVNKTLDKHDHHHTDSSIQLDSTRMPPPHPSTTQPMTSSSTPTSSSSSTSSSSASSSTRNPYSSHGVVTATKRKHDRMQGGTGDENISSSQSKHYISQSYYDHHQPQHHHHHPHNNRSSGYSTLQPIGTNVTTLPTHNATARPT